MHLSPACDAAGSHTFISQTFKVNISVDPSKHAHFATELEALLASVADEPEMHDAPTSDMTTEGKDEQQ